MFANKSANFWKLADTPASFVVADHYQSENKKCKQGFKSAIYSGWVSHGRFSPTRNYFKYNVFMMYLDLDEMPEVFALSRLWSNRDDKYWTPAQFKRENYLGDANVPLKEAVKKRINEESGESFDGSVRMLANLSYFGYCINPITCYYCFDREEKLRFVVAEVTNTPWEESRSYVLPVTSDSGDLDIEFEKTLHVSPFNPMNMQYHWRSNSPDQSLKLVLDVLQANKKIVNARLHLKREEIDAKALRSKVIRYPWMCVKVAMGIYWQALKLYLKGTPFYPNPKRK